MNRVILIIKINNESLHIPLIFWAPNVVIPKRFKALVSTVDVLPTLLEVMLIPHRRNDFNGSILFTSKGMGFCFTQPDKPYIAELLIQHRNIIRAVIKDNWKYIAAVKWLEPEERAGAVSKMNRIEKNEKLHLDIWKTIIHEELYDLSKDSGEQRNLMNTGIKNDLGKIVEGYKNHCKRQGLKDSRSTDKEPTLSEDDIKKLKSLGYL